jgi:hypothetical protein
MKQKTVTIHPHASKRGIERGATENEIMETVRRGEEFPAKFERTGFRKNFSFDSIWNGKNYSTKQIEAYSVEKDDAWIVITVIVKYF